MHYHELGILDEQETWLFILINLDQETQCGEVQQNRHIWAAHAWLALPGHTFHFSPWTFDSFQVFKTLVILVVILTIIKCSNYANIYIWIVRWTSIFQMIDIWDYQISVGKKSMDSVDKR